MSGELVPLRADLLASLERGGALSAVGLDLWSREQLTFEEYTSIGLILGRASSALRFALGDWLRYGEDTFGDRAALAAEELGLSPEARAELVRVARAVPRHKRRPQLTWSHHRGLPGPRSALSGATNSSTRPSATT